MRTLLKAFGLLAVVLISIKFGFMVAAFITLNDSPYRQTNSAPTGTVPTMTVIPSPTVTPRVPTWFTSPEPAKRG